jgi:hypothetical protein
MLFRDTLYLLSAALVIALIARFFANAGGIACDAGGAN